MTNILFTQNTYAPFLYLEKVKRAGENYTLKVIIGDDLPILWFAFSWQATRPVLHGLGIFLLLVSFWCVYELGYYENDYIAETYEEKPKLSVTYYVYKQTMQTKYPWLWSSIFGLMGVAMLEKARDIEFTLASILLVFAGWLGFLIASRCCFWVYNHLNKHTRTWLYIVLQAFRYYGFIVVASTNMIGTSLLSSNILARSVLYILYRYSGGNADNWPQQIPEKLLRCIIFVFMTMAIAIGMQSLALWQSWQTWAIIAWCLIQAKGQVIRMLAQVKPVYVDGSNSVAKANH